MQLKRHYWTSHFGLNSKCVQLGCEGVCSEIWEFNVVISHPIYGEEEKMSKERSLLMKSKVIDNKFAVCLDVLILNRTFKHIARNSSRDLIFKMTDYSEV